MLILRDRLTVPTPPPVPYANPSEHTTPIPPPLPHPTTSSTGRRQTASVYELANLIRHQRSESRTEVAREQQKLNAAVSNHQRQFGLQTTVGSLDRQIVQRQSEQQRQSTRQERMKQARPRTSPGIIRVPNNWATGPTRSKAF